MTTQVAQYRHEALFYRGPEEFAAATVPFLEAGLAAGEPVLVVTDVTRLNLVREQVGTHDLLHLADMDVVGHNPALIISAWRDFVHAHAAAGTPVRGVGEPVHPRRGPAELAACQLHEELLNLAFDATTPLRLLCPYDSAALPAAALEHARAAHPTVLTGGNRLASPAYSPPDSAALLARPLPPAPDGVATLAFGPEMLANLRAYVRTFARRTGVADTRAEDLVVAVNEITTNSVRHGGGAGELRMWSEPDRLVCEVTDRGQLNDPFIGRATPPPAATHGRGVWIANQLCDLVQIRSTAGGTTIRLHVRQPSAADTAPKARTVA